MFQECAYPVVGMDIRSGDRFLLYTDGVVEVENSEGEFFGDTKLEDVVRKNQSLSPDELSVELLSQIDHWRAVSTAQQDDMTLVVVDVA